MQGLEVDFSASRATRVVGTVNFKRKYGSAFPMVAITEAQPGRTVTPAELQAIGLVVKPEQAKSLPARQTRRTGAGKWPSYAMCIARAPKAHSEKPPPEGGGSCSLSSRRRVSQEGCISRAELIAKQLTRPLENASRGISNQDNPSPVIRRQSVIPMSERLALCR